MQALFRRQNRAGLLVLLLFVAVVAFVLYWRTAVEDTPGDYHVKTGNYRLQDGQYDRAIAEFDLALEANPGHPLAYLGIALALMHQNRHEASLEAFGHALALDDSLAVAYADRGILHDRMGQHDLALRDYRRALAPRSQAGRRPRLAVALPAQHPRTPPPIADRAAYLEAELRKPPEDRPPAPAGDRRAAAHAPVLIRGVPVLEKAPWRAMLHAPWLR